MASSGQLVLRQRTSYIDNADIPDDFVDTSLSLQLERPATSTSHIEDAEDGKQDFGHLSDYEWQQQIFRHNHDYYSDDLSLLKESSPSLADYFRLLTIEPGEFHDPLMCWLITEEFSEEAEYEAVSYTWGKGRSIHEIPINGREGFWITQNAFAALRRIRQKQEPRTVWIDGVCINQHHPLERSQQVGIMHQIYSCASTVLCWFGPCDATRPGEEEDEICTLHDGTDKKEVDCQASAVAGEDRWWHRLWTVQEYCLAGEVKILVGPHLYEYSELHGIAERHEEDKTHTLGGALKTLNDRQSISIHLRVLKDDGLRRLTNSPTFNLHRMLLFTKQCVCNDPRDRIYALAALYGGDVPLEVDYSLTVHQVYALATVWMMKQAGNLEMLLGQHWPRMQSSDGSCSWCPDFSYVGTEQFGDRALSLPVPHPGCEGFHGRERDFVGLDGGNLVLSGVCVDRIGIIATGFEADSTLAISANDLNQESKNNTNNPVGGKLHRCKGYIRKNCPNAVKRYKSEDGLSGALAATISTSGAGAQVSKKEIRHNHFKSAAALASELADRTLFVTQRGYIGLASNAGICLSDEIVILRGLPVPLILRRGSQDSGYRIVGQSYVHGLDETAEWQDIVLLGD